MIFLRFTLLDTLHGIRASERFRLGQAFRLCRVRASRTFHVSRISHSASHLSHPTCVSHSASCLSHPTCVSHPTSRLSHPTCVSHPTSHLSHTTCVSHPACFSHSNSCASSPSSSHQRHISGRDWSGWRCPDSAANLIRGDRVPPRVQKCSALQDLPP